MVETFVIERFSVCSRIIQVSKVDGWSTYAELTSDIIGGNIIAILIDNPEAMNFRMEDV